MRHFLLVNKDTGRQMSVWSEMKNLHQTLRVRLLGGPGWRLNYDANDYTAHVFYRDRLVNRYKVIDVTDLPLCSTCNDPIEPGLMIVPADDNDDRKFHCASVCLPEGVVFRATILEGDDRPLPVMG